MDGLHLGLALKSLHWHGGFERKAEPYLICYMGSEASVRDGKPLIARTRPLEGIGRGETKEFDGFGMMLFPPVETGELIVWQLELWESDQDHREAGEMIETAKRAIPMNSSLVTALAGAAAAGAAAALGELASGVARVLKRAGDDLVFTWSGSMLASEVQACEVHRGNDRVSLTFNIFATEEGGEVQIPLAQAGGGS